jgi:hypothetical protein
LIWRRERNLQHTKAAVAQLTTPAHLGPHRAQPCAWPTQRSRVV